MSKMIPCNREDLLKLIRSCERVARAEIMERADKVRAAFERELVVTYAYDNDTTWNAVADAANAAMKDATCIIQAQCLRFGVPLQFVPSLNRDWYLRGVNGARTGRGELRRVAVSCIKAKKREAYILIARTSVKVQELVIAGRLSSEDACAMFERLPSAASLMPDLAMKKIVAAAKKGLVT